MSYPHVIVSAVHEISSSPEEFWKDEKESLDRFNESEYKDEIDWRMCDGIFKSSVTGEEYPVEIHYHNNRDEYVAEVVFAGKGDIQDIGITGLEDLIEEVIARFDKDFTIEVYYWYDGVDRPGGTQR